MVERQLPKLDVAGSIPVARSKIQEANLTWFAICAFASCPSAANCGGYFPHLLISYRQRLHCSTQSITGGVRVTRRHLNRRVIKNRRDLKIVETRVRDLGFDASVCERAERKA
jgi:hypothetical protein